MALVCSYTFVCQEFVAHCGHQGVSILAIDIKFDVKILTFEDFISRIHAIGLSFLNAHTRGLQVHAVLFTPWKDYEHVDLMTSLYYDATNS